MEDGALGARLLADASLMSLPKAVLNAQVSETALSLRADENQH